MNEMPINELREHIDSALEWASEVSHAWTNTMMGQMIDREKTILADYTQLEKWDEAYASMVELVNLCHEAEIKLEEEDKHE